jgi:hypothetical protein
MHEIGSVYITLAQVAAVLGWSKRKARGWLLRESALVLRAGRWVTTRELLIAAFPEIWARIAEEREARELDDEDDGSIPFATDRCGSGQTAHRI